MTTAQFILVIRACFWVLAAFCAYFLFDLGGDVDLQGWLAIGMVSGIIGALFPWPSGG